MKKHQLLTFLFLVLFVDMTVLAANYYWKASPVDNLFTNVGNWETSIGSNVSPSQAPSVNDDVFFTSSLNIVRNIDLNGGFCRNFNFNASASFTFTGSFTIHGSLLANGNAYFHIVGTSAYNGTSGNTFTFGGSGIHTIDMGTNTQRFTGGGAIYFSSNTTGGTYSLINHNWNTDNTLRFNTQHFNSNGFQMDVRFMTIESTNMKTINLSNSTLNVNGSGINSDNVFCLDFNTVGTATTYVMTNTRIVANGSFFQMRLETIVSFETLILNNAASVVLYTQQVTGSNLTIDSLIINTPKIYIGKNSAIQVLNARTINFARPSVIETISNVTIGNIFSINEVPLCVGQSVIKSLGTNVLKVNTATPLNTVGLAYRAVEFGGSGIIASGSFNLGLNSGAITWGVDVPSTTFYWVGETGNWSDPTQWSIIGSGGIPQLSTGCKPSYADDVVFDASSFSAANQTITIGTEGGYCRNISFLDPLNEGLLQLNELNIHGDANFTGARGVNSSVSFSGLGSHTITSGATFTYNSPSINIIGIGTYTLTDNLIANLASSYFNHYSGFLNTNGKNLTVGHFTSRSYPQVVSNIRHIDISNSVLTHQNINTAGTNVFLDISYLGTFNSTGSHIIQTSNNIRFRVATVANNTPGNYLNPIVFNNISFSSPIGTSVFDHSFPPGASVTYNNVFLVSNANITKSSSNHAYYVDTFWLTSGRLYQFTNGHNYTITGAIQHVNNGCGDLVRINSMVLGSRVNLIKSTTPFNINNAVVKDINASAITMNVIGGQDAGNNLNVTVSPVAGRDMYWVNGTGNWSDGHGHWSVGVSGGNPAVTNPLGCIPRLIDNVFFDANSFSTTMQAVTIDIDAECRNMLWDVNAGTYTPRLAGISPRVLNVWGTLEFASGMTSPFNSVINMMGSSTSINAQSIRSNSVLINSHFNMNGGGRYDQLDNITSNSGISLLSGRFYTNTYSITANTLDLDVRTPNMADISNSRIILNNRKILPGTSTFYTYYAYHSGTGNWDATGSYIQSNRGEFILNNSVPVSYDTIVMKSTNNNNTISTTSAGHTVTAKWIEWQTATSSTLGNFITETLKYERSSINILQGGRTMLVNDTLIAYGTPCEPVVIQSQNAGVATNLNSTKCNFTIPFAVLTDVVAQTCTAYENQSIGTNGGNSINWSFSTLNPLSPMGADTIISCQNLPFIQGTEGFGTVPATYLWNTGETTSQISIDTNGVYSVTVEYASGCEASGSRRITVIDSVPPLIIGCPSSIVINSSLVSCDTIVSWIPPTASDCQIDTIISNYIPGDTFPVGVTIVTYTATDGVGNTSTCSFTVTVIDTLTPSFNGNCITDTTLYTSAISCYIVLPDFTSSPQLTITDNCGAIGVGTITVTQTPVAGTTLGVGTHTVWIIAMDNNSNADSCSFDLTVSDTLAPSFNGNCISDTTLYTNATSCDVLVPDLTSSTQLNITDNCGSITTGTITITQNPVAGTTLGVGTHTVWIIATDNNSNADSCSFDLTVRDSLAPVIAGCPLDITVSNDAGSCGAIVTWATNPTATDNCGTPTLTSSHVSGTTFPVGTTTVTYTATDASGNVDSCSFTVTVTDSELPVISITGLPSVICEGSTVTWQETITDNCGIASTVSSNNSGDVFAVGTTIVTYTVTDIHGNIVTDSFDVVVSPLPVVTISSTSNEQKVCLGTSLLLVVSDPVSAITYNWYQDGVFLGSGESHNVTSSQLFHSGLYTVVAENVSGCISDVDSIQVMIVSCSITIPEVFSPNDDGKNDAFFIEGLDTYPNTKVWIHNRWGTDIYQSDNYQNDWDGKSQSKLNFQGEELPEGTYFYILQLGGEEGQPNAGELYKGFIYLKR